MTLRRRAAWVLAVATVAQLALAAALVPGPDAAGWAAVERWYAEAGPAPAAMFVARSAAQLAAAWLMLASVLQLAAQRRPRRRLTQLAELIAPRFLRSVACGTATLSLGVGVALPSPAVAGGPPPSTAVMVPLDGDGAEPTPPGPSTTATTTTTRPAPDAPAPAPTSPPAAAPRPPAPGHDEVVVAQGDSFWSIAQDEVQEGDVLGFWHDLIRANRDRLVDPANPDLLYPGQILRLPSR